MHVEEVLSRGSEQAELLEMERRLKTGRSGGGWSPQREKDLLVARCTPALRAGAPDAAR